MQESFINKYVVDVKAGHPGYTSYTILSTREDMTAMVEALSKALAGTDSAQSASSLTGLLWSQYATQAGGSTSRVYLSFRLAQDLDAFHRPSLASRLRPWLGVTCLLYFFALALTGFLGVAQGHIPVHPIIELALLVPFAVALVGLAVAVIRMRLRLNKARHNCK